jgi:hypothetical protein
VGEDLGGWFESSIILWHPPISVVKTPISQKKFKKSNNQRLDPLGLQQMPTVFIIGPYRFHFYSADGSMEGTS